MKIYENTYSTTMPPEIDITAEKVFVASNIEEVTEEIEEKTINRYHYTLTEYDKDEYLAKMFKQQTDITALQEELEAAKILLGVE